MKRLSGWPKGRNLVALALAGLLVAGVAGVALGGADDDRSLRREEDVTWEVTARDDDDGDATEGDDGTAGGANTGDGDATDGDDGTAGGANTAVDTGDTFSNDGTIGGGTTYVGDGDATEGDDGTNGGANTFVGTGTGGTGDSLSG